MKYLYRILIVLMVLFAMYLIHFFGSILIDLNRYNEQLQELNNTIETNNKEFNELRKEYINDIENIDTNNNEIILTYKNY